MKLLPSAQAAVLPASFADLMVGGYVPRFCEQKKKCSARAVSSSTIVVSKSSLKIGSINKAGCFDIETCSLSYFLGTFLFVKIDS